MSDKSGISPRLIGKGIGSGRKGATSALQVRRKAKSLKWLSGEAPLTIEIIERMKKESKGWQQSENWAKKIALAEIFVKKPHVNPPVQASPERLEISRPVTIHIKNTSYEYIKGFALNNLSQALKVGDYDKRVEVTYGFPLGNYAEFLRWTDGKRITIGKIRIDASHDYEKYKQIQLNKTIGIVDNDLMNGSQLSSPVEMRLVANQVNMDCRVAECKFVMENGWDIKMDLMPEASIRLSLFPTEILSVSGVKKYVILCV